MTESLFTVQTPAVSASDGAPGITTGTTLQFAVAGTVTHIRWYVGPFNAGGTWTGALWEVTGDDGSGGGAGTGTLLASKAFSGTPVDGTWNTIALDTPVTIDISKVYRVGVHNGSRYVATNSFFTSALVNGDITACADSSNLGFGVIRQGTFIINASLTYPTQVGSSACYFADVVFAPDAGAGAVTPDGLAVTAALGTPALAQSLAIAPSGLAVTTSLGTPTLSQALAIAPSGIAVTAGLGTPAVVPVVPGLAIGPDGIAVTADPGSPTLAFTEREGSWSQLSGIVQEARADHARNQERIRNPIDCPEHGWPLQRTDRGLHCLFGGHVVR